MATTTGWIDYTEQTTPASPSASHQRLFIDSADHLLKRVDSSGAVTVVGASFRGCFVYNSGTQAINTTTAAFTFDTESFDTDALHSTVTNTSRITIPTGLDGKWSFQAGTYQAGADNGWLAFYKNGATVIGGHASKVNSAGYFSQSYGPIALVATDYVEFYASTNGATTFGHATLADARTWLSATYLGA